MGVGSAPRPSRRRPAPLLDVFGRARLPSRFGEFEIVAFASSSGPIEHVAVVRGDVRDAEKLPVRVHSECLTGDVLGSLKCDCRDQLELALRQLADRAVGALIYMRQEGRGIGLPHKIKAYALQDAGLDTVEANRHLGFDEDLRDYADAAAILRCLGVRSVVLFTNNPRKIDGLREHGVEVVRREPLLAAANPHNASYLRTKRRKLGHLK
jgi:GTP cyclohydrolase II